MEERVHSVTLCKERLERSDACEACICAERVADLRVCVCPPC